MELFLTLVATQADGQILAHCAPSDRVFLAQARSVEEEVVGFMAGGAATNTKTIQAVVQQTR